MAQRTKLEGTTINSIEILSFIGNKRYLCKCLLCNKIWDVHAFNIKRTKSCGCFKQSGYQDISGKYLAVLRRNAQIRKLDYSLTKEYLWGLFLKQNKQCILSGRELYFGKYVCRYIHKSGKRGTKYSEQTASLDRIDSSKGYIEGNVQWIHKDFQILKWDWPLDELYSMCQELLDYKKLKDNTNDQINT